MSAADDGAAREHHLWILDLESAAGGTMAELHLSGRKRERIRIALFAGSGSRPSPGDQACGATYDRCSWAWILYRVSRVQFALSLGHLKTWLLNDQKVAFGDLIEHCLSQVHTRRKSAVRKSRGSLSAADSRCPPPATDTMSHLIGNGLNFKVVPLGIQCDRQ